MRCLIGMADHIEVTREGPIFYGQDPTPTGKNPYGSIFRHRSPSELLAKFPWRGLRVLRLRLDKAQ